MCVLLTSHFESDIEKGNRILMLHFFEVNVPALMQCQQNNDETMDLNLYKPFQKECNNLDKLAQLQYEEKN